MCIVYVMRAEKKKKHTNMIIYIYIYINARSLSIVIIYTVHTPIGIMNSSYLFGFSKT